MGLFSRKKKLTKDEQDKLDKAREELKKYKEEDELEISRIKHEKELDELKQKENDNPPKVTRIYQKEPDDIWAKRRKAKEEEKQKEDLEKIDQKEEEEILARSENTHTDNKVKHSDKCSFQECDGKVDFFHGKKCKFCHNLYCFNHIQLEKHECVKTTPVKFLRKSWLRKYGVNISSGRYIVVCDVCGHVSQLGSLIDIAGEERSYHINTEGCDEKKVFLEEDLSHEKISKDIHLESVVPSDRMFWVCSHCRPPQKFTNRSEYIAHHYSHS